MFSKTARYYDKIYSFKDYQAEAHHLTAVIHQNLRSGGNRLLDVACGTGRHIEHLKKYFEVEGLDISEELLELARVQNPGVLFHQADMVHFQLSRKFDVVTCLFSSIGYVRTVENLMRAIHCMSQHVMPGGIVIIEPWFTPDTWHAGTVHALFIDEPELKIARVNTSLADGRLSYFDLHYLIGTPEGTEHFAERHELGLFERNEMVTAFETAGLEVSYDEEGLTGRALYIGRLGHDQKSGTYR
jgi:ubiquinone/menaquinone biosynthesis C-methylase UbiE